MKRSLRYIGLDVHKDTIALAVAETGRQPAALLEVIPNEYQALLRCLDRLAIARQVELARQGQARPSGASTVDFSRHGRAAECAKKEDAAKKKGPGSQLLCPVASPQSSTPFLQAPLC